MKIKEFREKYPQYNDMSDQDLAKSFHAKYYSDMPYDKFASDFGVGGESTWGDQALGVGETVLNMGTGFAGMVAGGLGGLGALALGKGGQTAADVIKSVEDTMTYQPRTDAGKKDVEWLGNQIEKGKIGFGNFAAQAAKTGAFPITTPEQEEKVRLSSDIGFDVGLNVLPFGLKKGGLFGRGRESGLSPEAQAELARRQAEAAPKPEEPIKAGPKGEQLDLLKEADTNNNPYIRGRDLAVDENGMPIDQRLSEELGRQERAANPTGDLFEERASTPEPKPRLDELQRPSEKPVERPMASLEAEAKAADMAPERLAEQRVRVDEAKAVEALKEENARPLERTASLEDAYLEQKTPVIQDLKLKNEGLREMRELSAEDRVIAKIDEALEANKKQIQEIAEKSGRYIADERQAIFEKDKPYSFTQPLGKGPGKKQQGGLGFFTEDPKFRAFKDSLPENLKGEAKAMWKEMNSHNQAKAPLEINKNQNAREVIARTPGMKDPLRKVADIERPWNEIAPEARQQPDISMGRLGRNLTSGSRMAAFTHDNLAMHYASQVVNNAMRRVMADIGKFLVDPKQGLKPILQKLKAPEMGQIWGKLAAIEGKDVPLTRDALIKEGFSTKQVDAAIRFREVMDATFKKVNSTREALGMKPIPYRTNYIPSRFLGDFQFLVRDGDGNLVHVVGAKTKWGAEAARKAMQEKHPELVFEDISKDPISNARRTNTERAYHSMLEMLDDMDPRVQSLESVYQDVLGKQAYDWMNARKHFMNKSGVQGAEGFKEWKSMEANAKEGFESAMRYVEEMTRWAEIQKAGQTMKQILSDPELIKNQPNAMKYISQYWESVNGRNGAIAEGINQVIDGAARTLGISRGSLHGGLSGLKYWMTAKFLYNPAFMATQAVQSFQMVPQWLSYLKSEGMRGSIAMAELAASKDMVPAGRSASSSAALKWANENGIVKSHILDDIRPKGNNYVAEGLKNFVDKSFAFPEEMARTQAYLTYFKFLEQAGVKGEKAYKTAANMVDLSMTDYRLHERPMLYQKFGLLGELMSSLTTFKHNQYSQLFGAAKNGHTRMLGHMMASQLLMAGVSGFYFREEIDSLIKSWNSLVSAHGWDFPKIDTVQEHLIKNVQKNPNQTSNKVVSLGMVSTMTGMDLSTKFSAADVVPNSPIDFFMPYYKDLAKMVTTGTEALMEPNKKNALAFANAASPSALKVLPELANTNKEGYTQLFGKDGADVKRDSFDWTARALATRSIKESMEQQGTYAGKSAQAFENDKRKNILDRYKQASGQDAAKLAKQYVESGGNMQTLVKSTNRFKMNQVITEMERMKGVNPHTIMQLRKYNLGNQYDRAREQ